MFKNKLNTSIFVSLVFDILKRGEHETFIPDFYFDLFGNLFTG